MIRDPMVVQEVTDEYVTFTHNKSTFAIILTEKKQHWFQYFPKTVLNYCTKEICAKQVAT